jgi:hypothetical protein
MGVSFLVFIGAHSRASDFWLCARCLICHSLVVLLVACDSCLCKAADALDYASSSYEYALSLHLDLFSRLGLRCVSCLVLY